MRVSERNVCSLQDIASATTSVARTLERQGRARHGQPLRGLLSLMFSLALRNGKLAVNPVRQVKRRKENNERVRFLTPRKRRR